MLRYTKANESRIYTIEIKRECVRGCLFTSTGKNKFPLIERVWDICTIFLFLFSCAISFFVRSLHICDTNMRIPNTQSSFGRTKCGYAEECWMLKQHGRKRIQLGNSQLATRYVVICIKPRYIS